MILHSMCAGVLWPGFSGSFSLALVLKSFDDIFRTTLEREPEKKNQSISIGHRGVNSFLKLGGQVVMKLGFATTATLLFCPNLGGQ